MTISSVKFSVYDVISITNNILWTRLLFRIMSLTNTTIFGTILLCYSGAREFGFAQFTPNRFVFATTRSFLTCLAFGTRRRPALACSLEGNEHRSTILVAVFIGCAAKAIFTRRLAIIFY
jgi:hypothetical protein